MRPAGIACVNIILGVQAEQEVSTDQWVVGCCYLSASVWDF